MPGLQWENGIKPPGLVDENLLIIGPDDFDDEAHVKIVLNEYTLKMESVVVILNGVGNHGKHRPKGFTYEGVTAYAYEWATREFWPMHLHDPGWWGNWDGNKRKPAISEPKAIKAYRRMNAVILERLIASGKEHAHVIAFWDRKCEVTEELMELSREIAPIKNFNIVRI